jgi:hypothetical protein
VTFCALALPDRLRGKERSGRLATRLQQPDKLGQSAAQTVDAEYQHLVHAARTDSGQQCGFAGPMLTTSFHRHGMVAEHFCDCPTLAGSHGLQTLGLLLNGRRTFDG